MSNVKVKKLNKLEATVIAVAEQLLTAGPTTTLNIKIECRRLYPNDKFYQADISEIMDQTAMFYIPNLTYRDGKYRVYSIVPVTQQASPVVATTPNNVSKKAVVKILRTNVGKFFGITFEKKDGSIRTLNGQMSDKNFMDSLGYLVVKTNKGNFKLVDPKKIISVTVGGSSYKVK